jgi:hypothetical protein
VPYTSCSTGPMLLKWSTLLVFLWMYQDNNFIWYSLCVSVCLTPLIRSLWMKLEKFTVNSYGNCCSMHICSSRKYRSFVVNFLEKSLLGILLLNSYLSGLYLKITFYLYFKSWRVRINNSNCIVSETKSKKTKGKTRKTGQTWTQ